MSTFFERLRARTPEQKKLSDCKLRLRLAKICLEEAKIVSGTKANSCLYSALSHLAEVPELNVNLDTYEYLQYQYDIPFDADVCILVKTKVKELEDFIVQL